MPWYEDDWDYPHSVPIRRTDGIRAKSQRGSFGKTWWAGRWIAALERLVDSGRLSRGRSYARQGQVVSLEIESKGVSAKVQGSRPKPYTVSIRFAVLSDAAWDQVIDAMAAQAIFAAKLLNGEMPNEIEELFSAAGFSLFPDTAKGLQTACSCPDYANPCKHIAAVYYLLGERFDQDPFLIFLLRGRSKEQLITALRARRLGLTVEEAAAESAAETLCEPLSSDPHTFWSLPGTAPLRFSYTSPPLAALPVKQRGRPAFWTGSADLDTIMDMTYQRISERAQEVLSSEDTASVEGK